MEQKKSLLSFIPNTITSLNVFSGCISITFAFNGQLELAALFILIAAIFDFFDGFTARLLNAYSIMGKELDSLADMVSFGVAPSVIVYHLISSNIPVYIENELFILILPYFAYIITIFSAIRLAKFNIDERQTESFIGVATPANAAFFGAFIFIINSEKFNAFHSLLTNVWVLLALVCLFSYLLIAEIPMFSLKFKNFSVKKFKIQLTFLGLSVVLLILLQLASISFIILLYILLSVINNILKLNKS